MKNNRLKFVFFGTGEFGAKVLETLCQNGYIPKTVVTAPDRPKGRKLVLTPSPVKSSILGHKSWNIKILHP